MKPKKTKPRDSQTQQQPDDLTAADDPSAVPGVDAASAPPPLTPSPDPSLPPLTEHFEQPTYDWRADLPAQGDRTPDPTPEEMDAQLSALERKLAESVAAFASLQEPLISGIDPEVLLSQQIQEDQLLELSASWTDWQPEESLVSSPEEKEEEEEAAASDLRENAAVSITTTANASSDDRLSAAEDSEITTEPTAATAAAVDPSADTLTLAEVCAALEALLFISDKPLTLNRLQDLLTGAASSALLQTSLAALNTRYAAADSGIELVEVAHGYQLRTKPQQAAWAKKLAKVQLQKLSGGALETLAIVAYKQPLMKEEIDKIRGVDSAYFLRGLMEKKMIILAGRSELPGRPALYATTPEFLLLFGLKDLQALPSLHEIERMIPQSQIAQGKAEDPHILQLRTLVQDMQADKSGALYYDPAADDQILKEFRAHIQGIPTSTPTLEALLAPSLPSAPPATPLDGGSTEQEQHPDALAAEAPPPPGLEPFL